MNPYQICDVQALLLVDHSNNEHPRSFELSTKIKQSGENVTYRVAATSSPGREAMV